MPAADPRYQVLPQSVIFQIGRDQTGVPLANDPLVGIVKRESMLEVFTPNFNPAETPVARIDLLCVVVNHGAAAFTLQCEQSANNNGAGVDGTLTPDAYADIPIRVAGTATANGEVVVQPGGRATFILEWEQALDDYLRFLVAEEAAFGDLTLVHFNGTLVTREREVNP